MNIIIIIFTSLMTHGVLCPTHISLSQRKLWSEQNEKSKSSFWVSFGMAPALLGAYAQFGRYLVEAVPNLLDSNSQIICWWIQTFCLLFLYWREFSGENIIASACWGVALKHRWMVKGMTSNKTIHLTFGLISSCQTCQGHKTSFENWNWSLWIPQK